MHSVIYMLLLISHMTTAKLKKIQCEIQCEYGEFLNVNCSKTILAFDSAENWAGFSSSMKTNLFLTAVFYRLRTKLRGSPWITWSCLREATLICSTLCLYIYLRNHPHHTTFFPLILWLYTQKLDMVVTSLAYRFAWMSVYLSLLLFLSVFFSLSFSFFPLCNVSVSLARFPSVPFRFHSLSTFVQLVFSCHSNSAWSSSVSSENLALRGRLVTYIVNLTSRQLFASSSGSLIGRRKQLNNDELYSMSIMSYEYVCATAPKLVYLFWSERISLFEIQPIVHLFVKHIASNWFFFVEIPDAIVGQ